MRYTVIPRTLIFLFTEDAVLLLKGAPTKKNFPNCWNGLGGHVERGETLLAAARRELAEESGISGVPLSFAGTMQVEMTPEQGIQVNIFKGHCASRLPFRQSEEGGLAWVPLADAASLDLVPDVGIYLERVRNFREGDVPFFAVLVPPDDFRETV